MMTVSWSQKQGGPRWGMVKKMSTHLIPCTVSGEQDGGGAPKLGLISKHIYFFLFLSLKTQKINLLKPACPRKHHGCLLFATGYSSTLQIS